MHRTHTAALACMVLAAGTLMGCSKAPGARSVQFFTDHADVRVATLQACRSQTAASADCENAAAAGLIQAQHERNASPAFPTRPAQ
jgi:hypothetical protein